MRGPRASDVERSLFSVDKYVLRLTPFLIGYMSSLWTFLAPMLCLSYDSKCYPRRCSGCRARAFTGAIHRYVCMLATWNVGSSWWPDTIDDAIVMCQTCRHGGHASHILDWFFGEDGGQYHATCAVANCDCTCANEF